MADYSCEIPTPYSLTQETPPVDVFEQIISTSETYYLKKREALWARFHDTGIGNPDTTYWIRCMTNRYTEIKAKWDIRFRAYEEYLTRLAGYTSIDLADSQLDSTSTNKTYDPPETGTAQADAVSFLSDQNVTDFSQTTHGGLEPATVGEYMDAVRNPYEEWAREFDKLFYWGM